MTLAMVIVIYINNNEKRYENNEPRCCKSPNSRKGKKIKTKIDKGPQCETNINLKKN